MEEVKKKKVNMRNKYVPKKREPVKAEPILLPFDTLKLKKKNEEGSGWNGERGYYYIKPVPVVDDKKPIRYVYLNHKYFTGLFPTKNGKRFNGDCKFEDGKKYLLFEVAGAEVIKIYEKVQEKV